MLVGRDPERVLSKICYGLFIFMLLLEFYDVDWLLGSAMVTLALLT
jgi:hypothetical protein